MKAEAKDITMKPSNLDSLRWTSGRKQDLLESNPSAAELRALGISDEEFAEWKKLYTQHGRGALRTTRLQSYRFKRIADAPR